MTTGAQNLLQGPVYNRTALDASLTRKRPGVTPDDQVPLLAQKALKATAVSEFTEADSLLPKKVAAAPVDRIAKAHLAATVAQAVFAVLAVIPLTRLVGLAGSRVIGMATGVLSASQAKGAVALAQRTAIVVATVIGFASLFAAAPVLSTVSLLMQSAVSLSEALKALSKKEWKAALFHLLMAASTAVAAGAILSKSLELAIASLAMSLVITIGFVLYAVKQRDPISALCYLTMAATQTFSLAETSKLLVERNRLQANESKHERTVVYTAPKDKDMVITTTGSDWRNTRDFLIPKGTSHTFVLPPESRVVIWGNLHSGYTEVARVHPYSDSYPFAAWCRSGLLTFDRSATTPSPALAGFWRS